MKTVAVITYLLLISFGLKAQEYNLGFESWEGVVQPVMNTTDSCTLPADAASNPFDNRLNAWSGNNGVLRTSDAHTGNYAAVVAIWYANTTGKLVLGQCGPVNVPGYIPCKQHFNSRIYGVSGYYKYLVDSFMPRDVQDTRAVGYVKTFKVNPSDQSLTVLSFDSLIFDRAGTYQSFQIPVNYIDSNSVPDSVSIWFESQNNAPGGLTCAYAHFLYLDDLNFHFSALPTGLGQPTLKKKVNIYPNPASGMIKLEYDRGLEIESIWLSDRSGRIIKNFEPQSKSLEVKAYPAGLYFLQIRSRHGLIREKIVLQ